MLAIFESFFLSNSTQVHIAANVGPKSTIIPEYKVIPSDIELHLALTPGEDLKHWP